MGKTYTTKEVETLLKAQIKLTLSIHKSSSEAAAHSQILPESVWGANIQKQKV